MRHSESIASLAAALVNAQSDIKAVEKSAVNPHFKSRYATLDSIVAMARPALAKHGLAVIASAPSDDGNALRVETMLVHASGEWLSNEVCIPLAKKDPQGAGAAVTYGRRFGLSSLLSLTSEEDDDGHAASQPAKRAERPAREAPRPSAPNAEPSADLPRSVPEPEDQVWKGRRLGDMAEGELAALSLEMGKVGKRGWQRAISQVRTNRSFGKTKAPDINDDAQANAAVARMTKAVEDETSALAFTK